MPEIATHRVRPRPHCRRYIDDGGSVRFGRPRVEGRSPGALFMRHGRNRTHLAWVARLQMLPVTYPSGFQDLRGACCGK